MLRPCRTESLTSEPSHPQFQALLARLDLMFSSAPMRPRSEVPVFGIALGRSGLRMLLPRLPRPKTASLPFGHNGTEAAAARPTRAVPAAETGVIRGDLWAEAAFTGARFMGTDRSTSPDRANCGRFARARANAETAFELAPWRLERAASARALADKDLQAFIKSDIRGIGQQR